MIERLVKNKKKVLNKQVLSDFFKRNCHSPLLNLFDTVTLLNSNRLTPESGIINDCCRV